MLKLGDRKLSVALVFLLLSALLPISFIGRTNPKPHRKWGPNDVICANKQLGDMHIMLLSGQIH